MLHVDQIFTAQEQKQHIKNISKCQQFSTQTGLKLMNKRGRHSSNICVAKYFFFKKHAIVSGCT